MSSNINKFFSSIKNYYEGINGSSLSGAMDVIVIQQPDGTLKCSPFYVRFGFVQVLRPSEMKVDIAVNGKTVSDVHMKLQPSGEAYFEIRGEEKNDDEEDDGLQLGSVVVTDNNYDSISQSANINRFTGDDYVVGDHPTTYSSLTNNSTNRHTQVVQQEQSHMSTNVPSYRRVMSNVLDMDSSHYQQQQQQQPQYQSFPVIRNPSDGQIQRMYNDYSTNGNASTSILMDYSTNNNNTTSSSSNNNNNMTSQKPWILTLNDEKLKKLNLREGENDAVFSISTKYQGSTNCYCNIYLWHWSDRLVISDIDGTITKSDVLGTIFSMIGPYWAHVGVVKLYQKITKNNYRMIYLSARPVGQATMTRNYIRKLKEDNLTMPPGPLLLSPNSVYDSFHREFIAKRADEFKIACLLEVVSLFPSRVKPMHAGFGNKISDTNAYKSVDVEESRIFTINPKGVLQCSSSNDIAIESYNALENLVDAYFPVHIKYPDDNVVEENELMMNNSYASTTDSSNENNINNQWTNAQYQSAPRVTFT